MKTQGRSTIKSEKTLLNVKETIFEEVTSKLTDKGFIKLWVYQWENMPFDIKLMHYLINRMSNKNIVAVNFIDIAKVFKTTRQKISRHLKDFVECGLIKYKRPCFVFVNPEIAYRGNANFRSNAVIAYKGNIFEW